MVNAETIQPLMFSDCDNITAEAAAVDMNTYANSIFPKTNPGSGYVSPGSIVADGNITFYGSHRRERAAKEEAVAADEEYDFEGDRDLEERLLFSTCPPSCNKHPNIPVCIALNCVTGGGRRRDQALSSDSYYQGQVFTLSSLIKMLNVKAGQLSLTYGCQISLFISTVDG